MNPEEIKPEVTADWARERAETEMPEIVKRQLKSVLAGIDKLSRKNEKSMCVSVLHPLLQKELIKRGFLVLYHKDHWHRYYTISW